MTTYYKKNSASQFILALECLALFLPDINNFCTHNVTVYNVYLNRVGHALIDSKIKCFSLCGAEEVKHVLI